MLERILQLLGAEVPFDEHGVFTDEGYKAYSKLLQTVWLLGEMGVITRTQANTIVTKLDNIADEQ